MYQQKPFKVLVIMKILPSHEIHESIMYPKQINIKHYVTICPSCKSTNIQVSILPPEQLHRRRCSCLDCGTTWDFRDKIPVRYAQKTL